MKILIVTQAVDDRDPILGFFISWIQEFASHCDSVTVIGQRVGSQSLADDADIWSLEKEHGRRPLSQVLRFWRLIWKTRKEYDVVFVHMTPIWILLGAPLWIPLRKRLYLWYEIKRGNWKLSAALTLVRNVFAASEHGLPTVSKKQITVGHGIDTKFFVPKKDVREKGHLVAVGRLTRVKQYDVLLRALAALPDCTLTIAGGTITQEDTQTEKAITDLMHSLNVQDRVTISWVPPYDIPRLLQRADCMMHASQGGLDKAVLQAMACGCPVVSTSTAAQSVLPDSCHATSDTLSQKTEGILHLSASARDTLAAKLRATVENDHSLSQCIQRIVSSM